MKRAFWYDEHQKAEACEYADSKEASVVYFAKNYKNVSITENGAIGYRTSGHALLDLNFAVSSLRAKHEDYIVANFVKAYYESPKYAIKWLFFLRDAREGLGERRSFKVILKYLAISHPAIAGAVLPYIPEYGRYDDALVLLETPLAGDVARMYREQLQADLAAMAENKPGSLLAKWLPSINTSSEATREYARKLCRLFKMNAKEYRHMLSKLRAYSNVTETKMSRSQWEEIDYNQVPAKANLIYDSAFMKRDGARRYSYYESLVAGEGKASVKGLMPYELVMREERSRYSGVCLSEEIMTELLWKKMVEEGFDNEWGLEDAIVVADGSGSMMSKVSGNAKVTARDVCNSLAIYFAEQLKGVFNNKAITFSNRPQFIDLSGADSLKGKLEIMHAHCEVANTNIEAVFDLILELAQNAEIPREELPKQVLVISDMEFDAATCPCGWGFAVDSSWKKADSALFEVIEKKFEDCGYTMPRLIFWNVCGRSATIPKVSNGNGLCLMSGFSQNAMKIAANKAIKDPYKALLAVLDSPRYAAVGEALSHLTDWSQKPAPTGEKTG